MGAEGEFADGAMAQSVSEVASADVPVSDDLNDALTDRIDGQRSLIEHRQCAIANNALCEVGASSAEVELTFTVDLLNGWLSVVQ